MAEYNTDHPHAQLLLSATSGFDYLFSNDIDSARTHFQGNDDPFNLLGTGICAFLEAALGMELGLMAEATRCLELSEAGTRQRMRTPKPRDLIHHGRFQYGLEWEILNADAVILLGLTHTLSESYMGYLQCIYSLNSAHSKFMKLYKTVFPEGLPQIFDDEPVFLPSSSNQHVAPSPSLPNNLVHRPSVHSLASISSSSSAANVTISPAPAKAGGFFSRLVGSTSTPSLHLQTQTPDGPVEDFIIAGTAFGFGLFNLVFSLLPRKIQGLVGFLGFKHDRKLALQALELSATKHDVHGVFAGLVLMTYYGVILSLSGYQADELKLRAQYKTIVDRIEARYPTGALWILNRAKIMRMSYDAESAIQTMQEGLKPSRPHSFAQADMLLIFELAWTLLGQRKYQEAADTFIRITELNTWSHGTYYFIAAGCHFSLGNYDKAQAMLDVVPDLIERKKIGGKDLPTEVFIKKKIAFYKEKQLRRGGNEDDFILAVKISPAEEIGIFWNIHARIDSLIAQAHIDVLTNLSPPVSSNKISLEASSPRSPTHKSPTSPLHPHSLQVKDDLDSPDELGLRALLLGIHHRTLKAFDVARGFLVEAYEYQTELKVSTWIGGLAMFELAVLDLKEAEDRDTNRVKATQGNEKEDGSAVNGDEYGSQHLGDEEMKGTWSDVLKAACVKLDEALNLATNSVDLSSRLDSRIAILKDEIMTKREILGILT
ncbi:mitochondrial outer membrane protein IML2 [Phlegmacium glaucopus]|nr:mitochondrial outer membrane protein IML2 [Phlegmacium glaucopus]